MKRGFCVEGRLADAGEMQRRNSTGKHSRLVPFIDSAEYVTHSLASQSDGQGDVLGLKFMVQLIANL